MRSEESSEKSKSKSNWKMNFMKWQQTINKASKVNRANSVCVCGNHDKCSALVRYLKVSTVVAVSVSRAPAQAQISLERGACQLARVLRDLFPVQWSYTTPTQLEYPLKSTDIRVHKVLICIVIDNDRPRDKPQIQVGQFPLCTPLYRTPLYLEASARVCTSM